MSALPAAIFDLAEIAARAANFARASRAAATDRAYRSDWADFVKWCDAAQLCALPSEPLTVGAYLTVRACELKVSTLSRRIAAIAAVHRLAGHGLDTKHPAISRVLAGIRRTYGSRQEAKTALLTEDLRRMVRALPATLTGMRDRAVLLVGFAGAFRRSELVALNLADITISNAGLAVTVRRSKTDQEGAGRDLGIPRSRKSVTCPVAALEAWVQESANFSNPDESRKNQTVSPEDFSTPDDGERIEHGAADSADSPLFRIVDHGKPTGRLSGDGVAQIVKRAAARIGIDPAKVAGHSLRSGFATSAARGGADLAHIMAQTGHKNSDVARRYIQAGNLLQNPASKAVKL